MRDKIYDVSFWLFLGLLLFWAVLFIGCGGGDAVTGPSESFGTIVSQESVAGTVEEDVAPAQGPDIKIHKNGRVVNNTQETFTACLFDKPYGAGTLVDEWAAKPGSTQSSYVVEGCKPSIGQVDIINENSCPTDPHGLAPVAALPGVIIPAQYAADSPQCTECVEEPVLVETEILEGEWGRNPRTSTTTELCFEYRTITTIKTWKQCDTVWTTEETTQEERPVDCEDEVCETIPEEGTTLSWSGKGDPQTECAAFGSFAATDGNGDFWICKAGNDRIVDLPPLSVGTCDNGKDISHFTACVCVD